MPACSSDRPETCQVGDLARKYGTMNGTSFQASYTDPYVSLKEGMGAFFGNRSFVVHFANTTRIACGNFSNISNAASNGNNGLIGQMPSNASSTLVPAFSNNTAVVTSTALVNTPTPTGPSAVGSASGTSSAAPAQVSTSRATREYVAGGLSLLCFAAGGLSLFL